MLSVFNHFLTQNVMNENVPVSERQWLHDSLERLKREEALGRQNAFESALEGMTRGSAEFFFANFLKTN